MIYFIAGYYALATLGLAALLYTAYQSVMEMF